MPNRPILLVDDDPTNLTTLRQILEENYRLVFACNGEEALLAVAKHRPSLILLDIQMPGMDGYEVCKRLKSNPSFENIPVIFVTSLSDMGNEKAGFSVGCVDYLIKPVSAEIVRARVHTHLSLVRNSQLQASYRDAVFMLGEAGHYNDNDTGVHIWRMAAYSRVLAKSLGWNAQDADLLEMAAAMHDTGKIGVPDAILMKPGKLTPEEWVIMQSHTEIGYKILSKSDAPLFSLAADIALHHHEKWDGSGYPEGLSGQAISEAARIVAIADVFDALSMVRPYKEAWPLDRIFTFMRDNSGTHFDPAILKQFLDMQAEIIKVKNQWDQNSAANDSITQTADTPAIASQN